MRHAVRLFGAALVLGFAGWAGADDTKSGSKADSAPITDDQFVIKAASSGMHEVEISNLAKTQATSPDVKRFAERMVTDHTKANKELIEAAKNTGTVAPVKMLEEHQKMVEKFRALKGAEFDKMYAQHAVESHQKSVDLFTNASKNVKDANLRAFAEKTLPVIKEHLEMAKKLNGGTGNDR